MIAYFAAIPVLLYSVICHKMVMNKDKEAVLFVNENSYRARDLLYVLAELKEKEIFQDVVACKMVIISQNDTSLEKAENKIVDSYDKIMEESGYDILSFDEIYTMNDGWDGEQNVYFNIRQISYKWIQIACNKIAKPADTLHGGCYTDVMNKYQALSPFAKYANACLFDSSEVTIRQCKEKNRSYTLWNRDQCFSRISEDEMSKLFSVFHLAEYDFNSISAHKSALILKNSFGYLNMHASIKNPVLYFGSYSKSEIFSVMDKISIDFYAPQSRELYIKHHIHDCLSEDETKRLYGNIAISLPNVPFEIMGKYLNKCRVKFDRIIGTTSTSLSAINTDNYKRFYPLGEDFAKTWWFYISIYVALLFARKQKLKQIVCDDVLKTQLTLLAKEIEYDVEILTFNVREINKFKDSLIICDPNGKTGFAVSKVDRTCSVIFLNSEADKEVFTDSPEMYAPVCIKKEKIADTECDILFREETLWIYSKDKELKKAARDFVFEKNLKNLGMRIYCEKITLPDAMEIFHEKFRRENNDLKDIVELQRKQIKLLTEYISAPDIIERRLRSTDDIYLYLDILQMIQKKYLIVIAVRDTPGNCLPQDVMEKLFDLGFTKFSKELWRMYIGVSIKSAVIFNQTGERKESSVAYSFNAGPLNLDVTSKAWRQGNDAAVIINGINYAANMRGLNIVVYDVDQGCLVDSVGFDAHTSNWHFIRKQPI